MIKFDKKHFLSLFRRRKPKVLTLKTMFPCCVHNIILSDFMQLVAMEYLGNRTSECDVRYSDTSIIRFVIKKAVSCNELPFELNRRYLIPQKEFGNLNKTADEVYFRKGGRP